MTAYRWLFDHALVRIDAETAHRAGFAALRAGRPLLQLATPGQLTRLDSRSGRSGVTPGQLTGSDGKPVRAMGIEFPGVLGLAAGFDKNAEGIDALAALGFGFVEVGTVTGEPQPGNPRPRLFRLPKDRAVVNRMGFNNDGAEEVAARLARRRLKGRGSTGSTGSTGRVVVGVNIGKTKAVPEGDTDAVIADYQKSTGLLAPYADYLVVNVSSPNTPGLRDLQSTERLRPLLQAVRRTADSVTSGPDAHHSRRVPLLVKIAPDLADADVLAVADLATELGLDGVVATNTTISRAGLVSTPAEVERAGPGGLSGAPLRARALEVLRLLRERVGPELTIIAVGGIGSAADARERLDAGATLLQAYTAFVYEGAGWPRRVQRELAAR